MMREKNSCKEIVSQISLSILPNSNMIEQTRRCEDKI